jgi:hypothetical protein
MRRTPLPPPDRTVFRIEHFAEMHEAAFP